MVRIQDSQSWHTGSIPVGTTQTAITAVFFYQYVLTIKTFFVSLHIVNTDI